MAKRRTKDQKILTTLRKLQDQHAKPVFPPTPILTTKSASYLPAQLGISSSVPSGDYSYVRRDLTKILLLGALAIGIQVVLSFLISNTQFVSNIPLLGRR